jgi:hypothetical protein
MILLSISTEEITKVDSKMKGTVVSPEEKSWPLEANILRVPTNTEEARSRGVDKLQYDLIL